MGCNSYPSYFQLGKVREIQHNIRKLIVFFLLQESSQGTEANENIQWQMSSSHQDLVKYLNGLPPQVNISSEFFFFYDQVGKQAMTKHLISCYHSLQMFARPGASQARCRPSRSGVRKNLHIKMIYKIFIMFRIWMYGRTYKK